MVSVTIYPKEYVDELQLEITSLKANLEAGKLPVFDNIDALIEKLENTAIN